MADDPLPEAPQTMTRSFGSGSRWYGLQFNLGDHKLAQVSLLRAGIESFCPMLRRDVRVRKTTRVMELPLFAPYMFVRFDVDATGWRVITRTRGVKGLFPMRDERPEPAAFGAVEEIMERHAAGEFDFTRSLEYDPTVVYEVEEDVRIISGPFTSFNGIVASHDGERLKVFVSMFGRPTEVELLTSQVEAVSARTAQAPLLRARA
jgi:transcriptional antiterminator NusG